MQSHIYAGFLGGLASSVTLQPLDLLKTRMQQSDGMSFLNTVKSLNNVKDAWRGTLPSVIRTSCGAGLYFGVLNSLRQYKANQRGGLHTKRKTTSLPKLSAIDNVLTGATARATVGFIMMPITVVKVRLESNLFAYDSMSGALRDIVNGPLGWRGLFSGYGATVSRDAPYAGIYMLLYDFAKDRLAFNWMSAPVANTMAASTAAILATTITAPFDTIKTRIQVSKTKVSFKRALTQILNEGWISLFDGLSLRLVRKGLAAGISWCIYEEVVKRM